MRAKEIAVKILRQLGGNKFIVMTGAKKIGYHHYETKGIVELSFKIGKNSTCVNTVRIHYVESKDLYNMYFNYEGITKDFSPFKKEMASYEDIYCDQMQDLFTSTTGLYTRI
ncbi:MAG: hypothetical protein LBG15_07510 [Dysgonamonadaceae bacterium]|jgi:hypothetical protein|nr:hypothetical protein [Dysgonamonadaceae bacterium]